ncbi:MAG: hypothetical protein H7326_07100 [Bdellovibrionaceae bacterium]|nr:hypothetical protein [Pseudobdellovibrionaceae bacterium]
MRRDDYILMSSLALLNAFPETRSKVVVGLLNDQVFDLDQLRRPQKFSLGFRIHHALISMNKALMTFDEEGMLGAQVVLDLKDSRPLLQIKTSVGTKSFDLEVTFSSPFAMSSTELVELLNAQSFDQEIWQSVLEFINASNRINQSSEIDIGEIKKYLINPNNQNHFNVIVESVIELVQIEALVRNAAFQIPLQLNLKLKLRDPDLSYGIPLNPENKDPRYLASLQLQKQSSWGLASAEYRWEMYLWNELPLMDWEEHPVTLESAREDLVLALKRIYTFSDEVATPFTEAFQMALFVLNDPLFKSLSVNPGFVTAAKIALEKNNYSERAKSAFDRVFQDTGDLLNAGLTPEVVCSLKAFSIGNVFGGMGSWNDQAFPKPEDSAEFKASSNQLYQALQVFFIASLNKIC